jgi:O-antigen ligase
MQPLWFVFWSVLFSLCWLVPVHLLPWSTFPADAWTACMALIAALAVMMRTRSALSWHSMSCLAAGLVFLPWLQFFVGLLPYAGLAWMSCAYLLGFLLALLIGARWEQASTDQLAHALFIAIGVAAIASVALQLYGWLGLQSSGVMGMWSLDATGDRPYANLGQPNQLATLLLWGLMACFWAYLHKKIGAAAAVFIAAFLLLGIALTQSRAGYLGLSIVLAAVWFWRGLWPSRILPRIAAGLYIYALTIPFFLQWLNAALLLGQHDVHVRVAQQGELRLRAWRMFIAAVMEQPWFGYGWTGVGSAQIAVADQFPNLYGIFQNSHNIFLDLVLWTGLPVGLFVAGMLVRWFWVAFRAVHRSEDAVLILLLVTVGVHALVEFPLQYAYFLLPAGFVMGMLNVRLKFPVIRETSRWVLPGIWMAGVLFFGVIVRDYAQVDASYTLLRLEQSIIGQGRGPMGGPPDVWVLKQLREWIVVARYKPHPGMSQQELDEMTVITRLYPSLHLSYDLATALVLNGKPDEAQFWLKKICKISDENACRAGQLQWAQDTRMAAVQWPK